jgi:hypothetical protein
LIPVGDDVTVPRFVPPTALTVTVSRDVDSAVVNVAVTFFAASIVTTQLPVPEHAPLQPANVLPLLDAVSVTTVPDTKLAEHTPGQLIEPGDELTVPVPVPAVPTVSSNDGGAIVKVAVTVRAALIVTTQLPVPEHAPLHPVKLLPALGVAASVTVVPAA